jgi:hypothetical protein
MEEIEHNGVRYPVPNEVLADGREAVGAWWDGLRATLPPEDPQPTEDVTDER